MLFFTDLFSCFKSALNTDLPSRTAGAGLSMNIISLIHATLVSNQLFHAPPRDNSTLSWGWKSVYWRAGHTNGSSGGEGEKLRVQHRGAKPERVMQIAACRADRGSPALHWGREIMIIIMMVMMIIMIIIIISFI